MAGVHFEIDGSNEGLIRKLRESRQAIINSGDVAEQQGVRIENSFKRIAAGAATLGVGLSIKELITNITQVRGEFQKFEAVLGNTFNDTGKAKEAMRMISNFAASTPFQVDQLTGSFVKLANMGFVPTLEEMTKMGDLASSTGKGFDQLTEAIIDAQTGENERLKEFGIRASVNGNKVTYTFKEQATTVENTASAIRTYILSLGDLQGVQGANAKISATLTGEISNLSDKFTAMYNEIGQSTEGIISSSIGGVAMIVENYETIGKTILELAAVYGTYKAVLMSVAAYQSMAVGVTYAAEITELSKLIPLKQQSANQDVIAAVASGKLTQAKAEQVVALRAEIAAKIQSLQATKIQAQAEFSSALASYKASRLRYTVAQEQVALAQSQMSIAIKSGTVEEIAAAKKNAQTASLELNNAAVAKNTAHKGVNIAATNSKSASEALNTLETGKNSVAQTVNTTSTNILTVAKTKLAAASKALGLSMLANPYVLAAAAVVGLGYAIYKVVTAETELDKAHKRLNDATSGVEKGLASEVSKLTSLERKLAETKKGTEEYNNIKKTIIDNYGQYYKGLDGEIERVGSLSTVYGQLVEAMRLSIGQRKFESFFKAEQDNLDKTIGEKLDTAYETLIDKYGKTKGGNLYNQFFDSAMHGEPLSPSAIKDLQNATFMDVKWGSNAKDGIIDFKNSVFDLRSEISKETKATEEVLDDYKSKFQITEEEVAKILEGDSSSTNEQPKDNKTLKQLLLDIDASKSKIKELQEQANKGLISSDKIKEEQDVLSKLTSDYKNRTGLEYGSTKQESAAEKLRKQQESIREQQDKNAQLEKKQSLDRQRQQQDLEHQAAQAEIDALDDSFEKKEKQRALNNKKEIQALERQKEDYINAVIQFEKEKFDAQEELNAKNIKGYNKKTFDSSTVKVDSSAFNGIINNTSKKQLNDKVREQEDSWNEYLIKFGDYQQKRKAIIEKYDKLIKEAEDAGKAATHEKDKQNAVDDLDNSIKNSSTLMGQLFADASQKSVSEIQKVIEKAELLMQYLESVKDEKGNAQIGGKTVSKKDILGLGVSDNTLQNLGVSTEEVEALRNAISKLKGELGGKSPFILFESQIDAAIRKISQGGNKNIAQGITEIGGAIASFSPAISQFGQDLGNIFGSDDLGNKIAGVSDALGGVGQTAAGVGQIMSGDIVGGVMSAVSGISSVVSALDGLFGADYSEYDAMVAKYDVLLDVWDELLDKKKAYIKESYGAEATKAGEEALKLLNSEKRITKELASSRLDSGASAGSHSINYRMWKGSYDYNGQNWKDVAPEISNALGGVDFSSMWSMLEMSSEQLEWIKTNYSGLWAHMDGDFKGYLDNIIQYGDTEKEIIASINEQLTQTSFDSLFDGFLSTLMDMDASSKDFADNFEEYMRKAVFTSMFAKNYEGALEEWYKSFAEANKKEGGINADDVKNLKSGWDDIVNGALSDREAWEKIVGSSSDDSKREASKKGIATASQDSVDENNGRLAVMQTHTYDINEGVKILQSNTDKIAGNTSQLICLADIDKNMSSMMNLQNIAVSHLSNIENNTARLATIEETMSFIKTGIDTLNTKGITLKR